MKKRKKFARFRGAAAVVLAVLLLSVTGFGATRMLGGPEPVTDGKELKNGAYVSASLTYVMDVIGVEKNGAGGTAAYYAVAPIGDVFVTIRFPAPDAENMMTLEDATDDYLTGISPTLPFRLTVSGAVKHLTEEEAGLLARWFEENAAWMSRAGVITAVENYGDYLSGVMIDAGGIGTVSKGLAAAAGIAAAALMVYAAAEFTLAGAGVYDRPRKKEGGDV